MGNMFSQEIQAVWWHTLSQNFQIMFIMVIHFHYYYSTTTTTITTTTTSATTTTISAL